MGGGMGTGFGKTLGSFRTSKSSKDNHLYGKPGQVKKHGYKETHIGPDGRAIKEIHHTDHNRPKYHTNPHEHIIEWSPEGHPIFKK